MQSRDVTNAFAVEILGIQREFVSDRGSGISLIQPGVYPSEVKSTKLSPFPVTGKRWK
jgi:hypothetical protein